MTWREWVGLIAFSLLFGALCGWYYRSTIALVIGVVLVIIPIYQSEQRRVRF